MKNYLITQLKEFNALEVDEKICLIGSWIAGTGAALLIVSSASTLLSWGNGTEPNPIAKRSMFLGLGFLVGGSLFTTGADMEMDRQINLKTQNSKTFESKDAK